MINPNRVLIALLVGVLLLESGFAVLEGTVRGVIWMFAIFMPLIVALKGRGGIFLYWPALCISWLLAAMMLVLVYDIYLFANSEPPYDGGQEFDYAMGLLIFILSAIGLGCHFCITRTHPAVNKTRLARELNSLNIGLISGLVFGFGANFMLLAFCVEGDWTFSEIMWVYWFESVMITGFRTWTITKLDQFDASDGGFIHESIDEIKKELVDRNIRFGFSFYGVYLALIVFLLGIPEPANIGYLSILIVAYFASHYFGAQQNQREFRNRRPRLTRMQTVDGFRILAMHLAMMLAMLGYGSDDPAPGYLFVMIKALIDIVIVIVEYRQLRLMAIESPA